MRNGTHRCYLCRKRAHFQRVVYDKNGYGRMVPVCHHCLNEATAPKTPVESLNRGVYER